MNLENRIEIGSVSEFLEAVKQIYCDKDHQLFYRGVSKVQYAAPEYDHPGIYRNKNWIENEDKMFYELTAKCPEYFKDCKTTFEHLVMMQHYGYPTRLLDITSNPLVALYFACGGLNGSNSEDGQLISYHIKKNDIRDHESLNITLLSNVSKNNQSLEWKLFGLYQHQNTQISNCHFMLKASSNGLGLFKTDLAKSEIFQSLSKNDIKVITNALKILFADLVFKNKIFALIDDSKPYDSFRDCARESYLALNFSGNMSVESFEQMILDRDDLNDGIRILIIIFLSQNIYQDISQSQLTKSSMERVCKKLELLLISIDYYISNFQNGVFYKYLSTVKNDYISFEPNMISAKSLLAIQCVLPKQNNPRLIAQQGAFLLFGFKDAASNKTATPIVPDEMYGKFQIITQYENGQIIEKQQSSQKAEIIIKGSEKQKILDELKILGISNSTMFPEIDNIANELKNQYAKL